MRPPLISDTRNYPGGGQNIVSRWIQAPVRDGNCFALLNDAHIFFARMLAAIEEGKHYVLAEFYLVESGHRIRAIGARIIASSDPFPF